jgi:hypothetical protein
VIPLPGNLTTMEHQENWRRIDSTEVWWYAQWFYVG